jgi:hypothetical protein
VAVGRRQRRCIAAGDGRGELTVRCAGESGGPYAHQIDGAIDTLNHGIALNAKFKMQNAKNAKCKLN